MSSSPDSPRPGLGRLASLGALWPFVHRHLPLFIGWLLALGVSSAATLVLPAVARQVIDQGFSAGSAINRTFALAFAVTAVLAIATATRLFFVSLLGERVVADLRGRLYGHLIGGQSVLVYVAFLLLPVVHWVVYHSRFGLRLRACGENPHAADAAGVSVERTRYLAMFVAGVLCSFSGAYLTLVQSGFFLRDMSAGAGYLALTALVFGNWRPLHTVLGCLMFGLFGAIQIQLEGVDLPVVGRLPGSLILAIPYIVTVVVLAGLMAKSVAPKAIGKPFVKSR